MLRFVASFTANCSVNVLISRVCCMQCAVIIEVPEFDERQDICAVTFEEIVSGDAFDHTRSGMSRAAEEQAAADRVRMSVRSRPRAPKVKRPKPSSGVGGGRGLEMMMMASILGLNPLHFGMMAAMGGGFDSDGGHSDGDY